MDKRIFDELMQEEPTPFHKKLLEHCKQRILISRNFMSAYYPMWDEHNDVYLGHRQRDRKDARAKERKEPEKMVVPLTYAQVQTFASFCFLLYTQNPTFFELSGTGIEDWKSAKIAEAVLQRDLIYSSFYTKLYQHLIDVGRFGLSIFKVTWAKETTVSQANIQQPAQTPQQQPAGEIASLSGTPLQQLAVDSAEFLQQTTETTKFLGNKVYNVSPYRFFPDPRLPLTRFQEGEFCGSEDEYTRDYLKQKEKEGLYAGITHIKPFTETLWRDRMDSRMPFSGMPAAREANQMERSIIVTEVQIDLIPADFTLNDGQPLGAEKYPVRYVVCYGNDNRVIKCEPLGYDHGNFTYYVSQLSPDQQQYINAGLAENIDQLQDVLSWLINSHITSVRKTIQNYLIVDPEGVEMNDLIERRSVIRLKKGAARSGVDRWVKQLQVADITGNHMKDADTITQLISIVTGVNDNAMGQYSRGRRSAEQTRAVNAGASSRLRMQAMLIYNGGLEPMGRDMVCNSRQGLDEQTVVRVMGLQVTQPQSAATPGLQDIGQFLTIDKSDLIGNYDFDQLDMTLPSEKPLIAESIQEVLMAMMQNPEAVQVFGLDPKALLFEYLELKGIRNPQRFMLPQVAPQAGQPMSGQPPVQPMNFNLAQLFNGQSPGPTNLGQSGTPTV